MKIEHRIVDEVKKIVCITTPDERWYGRDLGEGKIKWIPSVTWILQTGFPKGIGYYRWLADKGWDESIALKEAAGIRGSKIHAACSFLLDGQEVTLETKFLNTETNQMEELTPDEYEAVMSFKAWWDDNDPVLVAKDITVFDGMDRFAGTVDLIVKLKGVLTLIDLKTGNIWESHTLQVSAYKHAIMGEMDLAILQIGYKRNKAKYKYTPVEDKFDLFLAAREIWWNEMKDVKPLQRDFPLSISINVKKEA